MPDAQTITTEIPNGAETHYASPLWRGLPWPAEASARRGLTMPLFRPSGLQNSGTRLIKAVLDAVSSVTTTTAFAYNDANELVSQSVGGTTTSFAYDAWGRMTSKSDGTYSATYAYRYGNKLASVTSNFPSEGNATYQYDGAGKRRQRTAGGSATRYRWDIGWNVLNEEDNLGSLMRTHIMDSSLAEVAGILGDVAGTNPATGAYRYYVSDHLGSTRGLYDGSKSALGSYEYTPYGEVYASSGSVALEGLAAAFTGKPWDAAAQMYYFPYRWYSPSAARWLTRDPLGMVDGPNVYSYVRGKPMDLVDAWGLASGTFTNKECLAACAGLHKKAKKACQWVCKTLKGKTCNELAAYCDHIARHHEGPARAGTHCMTLYNALCLGC